MARTYYKTLTAGGTAPYQHTRWSLPDGDTPGEWMPPTGPVKLCRNGYHGCTAGGLLQWLDARVFVMELRGGVVVGDEKVAAPEARLVRELEWSKKTQRLFAADCAARVLHLFEAERPGDDRPRRAIEASRAFARGEIGAAAWIAARAAARAAAGDAARDAARAAAGDAAWIAAWIAAGDAARDAAWIAARAAARDAERRWQTKRLLAYLYGHVKHDVRLPKKPQPHT